MDRHSPIASSGPVFAGRSARGKARFESARRVFKILDLVSRHEGIAAKALARELGVSRYYLINILIDEGYLERTSARRGYRLGPAVSVLHERSFVKDLSSTVEPLVEELARRSQRHAYLGLFANGAVEVS